MLRDLMAAIHRLDLKIESLETRLEDAKLERRVLIMLAAKDLLPFPTKKAPDA